MILKDVAGNIYAGQLLGANKPAEAVNVLKVFFTLTGLFFRFNQLYIHYKNHHLSNYISFIKVFQTTISAILMYTLSNYIPYAFGNDP